jgi:penicillin-binding protein 1C
MDYLHRNGQGLKLRSDPPQLPQGLEVRNIRYEPAIEPARREVFLPGMGQDVITANAETVQRISGNTSGSSNSLTRISYPGEGTIIALDPEIPPARQGVVFRASGGIGKGWQWRLDGKQQPISNKVKAYAWFPMPGRHTLTLLNEQGKLVDTVHFEVRGAQLKTASVGFNVP